MWCVCVGYFSLSFCLSFPPTLSVFLYFPVFFLSFIHFFFFLIFVLILHHALLLVLLRHSYSSSSLFFLNIIFFFSPLSCPPFLSFLPLSLTLSSLSTFFILFSQFFVFGSPPASPSLPPSLLSFSLTLLILTLPSALYKLDWWLNPTCIKVRITIFTPALTHVQLHTNGSRQWQPYSHTLPLPPTHTHYPFLSLTMLTWAKVARLLAEIRFKEFKEAIFCFLGYSLCFSVLCSFCVHAKHLQVSKPKVHAKGSSSLPQKILFVNYLKHLVSSPAFSSVTCLCRYVAQHHLHLTWASRPLHGLPLPYEDVKGNVMSKAVNFCCWLQEPSLLLLLSSEYKRSGLTLFLMEIWWKRSVNQFTSASRASTKLRVQS